MKSKRFLCLLLVLLMVFSLTPSETRAETTVYFTAVNDQLLPDLSDETMEKLLAAARQGAAQAGDLAVNTAHGLKKKAGLQAHSVL